MIDSNKAIENQWLFHAFPIKKFDSLHFSHENHQVSCSQVGSWTWRTSPAMHSASLLAAFLCVMVLGYGYGMRRSSVFSATEYCITHMLHGAGIFTYIWVILFGQMLLNIPYMEHMGHVHIMGIHGILF